ncbi:efflux RND transporter periplasmic adaptor subunit [Neiella sp. HB171785]|uniref:Efflux RND transporter periplasmic adaptor subunit n=2 Tax=Neiella litorisoli TaxID=2771431 RepID=A0A8J6QI35_9GAMM|nr:efflux RND transporter periplasmic adaptor subunit [Neiella litorisoli]
MMVAAVLAFGSLVACSPAPEQPQAAVVRPVLTEVVSAAATNGHSLTGTVQAAQRADLSFRIAGRLTAILVQEGDVVEAGQLLATLESSDLQLAKKAAELEYESARADHQRASVLFEQNQAISKSDMDQITTRLQLAENRLNEANQQLAHTQLLAPFAGVIGQRMVDNHVQVQANEVILMLHDVDNLEVAIQVPDHIMMLDSDSDQAVAQLTVLPDELFPLRVKSYTTQADPTSQTYTVTLAFEDVRGHSILPGMTARVFARTDADTDDKVLDVDGFIFVPLTAVQPDNQGQQYVWIINQANRTEQRFVETGNLFGDRIAITANLKAGERIAIAGTASLQAGVEVRPTSHQSQR